MNVTPSQREFYAGHLSRRNIFWPLPRPVAKPEAYQITKEDFERAWELLAEPPTIRKIQEVTAHHFGVPVLFMFTQRRAREAYLPRAAAIYLCKKYTLKSLPVMGRHFGGRDHTTIMHSVRAIEKMIALNHPIAKDIEALSEKIGGTHD